MKFKPRALVLFSGGMDSMLAVKLLQKQGLEVEGVNFVTPFSSPETAEKSAGRLGLKLHVIRVSRGYFGIIRRPVHGYGANMNPCIDCKIYMLRKAKAFARKAKADLIATGEVLGERPFSQGKGQMKTIEEGAGLKNRIVRPLSGKLLPPTLAEKKGLVDREGLMAIKGRSRKPQMRLAREFGIREYPTPGGGCLLTDPGFSKKLRDFLENEKTLAWQDVELLRLGRHFRPGKGKIIVGRNEQENGNLLALAKMQKLAWMEAKGFKGPVTVLQGREKGLAGKAAGLTVRYSDAPKESEVELHRRGRKRTLRAKPISRRELERMRIK
jgi:tRNA-specific 2-thiouridylase